jgi:hypothetical protein
MLDVILKGSLQLLDTAVTIMKSLIDNYKDAYGMTSKSN